MSHRNRSRIRMNARVGLTRDRQERQNGYTGLVMKSTLEAARTPTRLKGGVRGMRWHANFLWARGRISAEDRDQLIKMAGTCSPGYWGGAKRSMICEHASALAHRHTARHRKGA